jgi:hypothetical protein
MGAGASAPTKTIDRIVTIAKAIGGIGSSRGYQGLHRFGDAENFYRNVEALTASTQAYFWASLRGIQSEGPGEIHRFLFEGELYVSIPKDTDNDLNAAWDLAISLQVALETRATYQVGEFPPIVSIRLREIITRAAKGIAVFELGAGAGRFESIDP